MFLGFANFIRKFIKNFNKIIAPFISILQTIGNKILNTLANKNEKISDVLTTDSAASNNSDVSRNNKNLSSTKKLKNLT